MTDTEKIASVKTGVMSATLAYTLWGFLPLYFIFLRGTGADEILTHRILWAVPVGALIIMIRKQWPEVRVGLANRRVLMVLSASAAIIALNWVVYIFAVQSGRTMEASLGYYINPLMYVLVGVVVLGEKLRRGQMTAVALATIGVLVLTIYGGHFPFLSLLLAMSFTAYGFLRKQVAIGAMPGLFIETIILAPLAALYLGYLVATSDTTVEHADLGGLLVLLLAGPFTVIPLVFFAIGARRLSLATLGFLQFLGPSIQFIIALIDGEPFSIARQICFGLIWSAAAIFAADAWINRQRTPQKPMSPKSSGRREPIDQQVIGKSSGAPTGGTRG